MTFGEILSSLLIGPLKLIFEIIFTLANRWIEHPGISIIVLSLAMNILVLPLYKRADAMQEEARDTDMKLSKGISHIKKTFSGDERMLILQTYYRQNNYSPLSSLNGSISLLLEIPFFMAAYQFLSSLEILKGVSLGPITDLSAPDGLIVIGGFAINLLPFIMTGVNFISSALYLKGFPLKTKIQLYAMALFFLVFLYTSPSGLVFYWILNNVFSLVKTIFYKLKNPKKVLTILMTILGVLVLIYNFFIFKGVFPMRRLFLVGLGIALLLPLFVQLISKKFPKNDKKVVTPNKKLFYAGAVFLTVLIGLVIPTTFIAASPQEYVDLTYFSHPIWYIVSAFCLAFGTFVVWMQVFYKLANNSGKVVIEKLVWILCCLMTVNYMFFGTKLGNISATLKYDEGLIFANSELLINLLVMVVVAVVAFLVVWKLKKAAVSILLCATIALSGMSVLNIVTTVNSVSEISQEQLNSVDKPFNISLSKNGKNVVVLILDRAAGSYLPYMFKEKPELEEQFSGFTYYKNTVSFGGNTNFASPALLGGYEYTPVELNKRDNEWLVDKHNESLKVLPVLFSQNGFKVTVADPVYANYNWLPDATVYDDYPEIDAYITSGKFSDVDSKKAFVENNKRNFFCFSIMKTMPVFLQSFIYNDGKYIQSESTQDGSSSTVQTATSMSTSSGLKSSFMDQYNVLTSLPYVTQVTDDETNTFTSIYNYASHEPMLLQAPDYTPSVNVDNTEYDAANKDRFVVDGKELKVDSVAGMQQYHSNIATIMRVGDWLDYLREVGVYDNTKIIIVSDHGIKNGNQSEELIYDFDGSSRDLGTYYPLFMVKDFDSKEFTVSDEFMTNADTPILAVEGLIENPINPFTGKEINDDEKKAHDQFLIFSSNWQTDKNNGKTFTPAYWLSVKPGDISNHSNWTFYKTETVLDEYESPDK